MVLRMKLIELQQPSTRVRFFKDLDVQRFNSRGHFIMKLGKKIDDNYLCYKKFCSKLFIHSLSPVLLPLQSLFHPVIICPVLNIAIESMGYLDTSDTHSVI
jgi:hypothetical protein